MSFSLLVRFTSFYDRVSMCVTLTACNFRPGFPGTHGDFSLPNANAEIKDLYHDAHGRLGDCFFFVVVVVSFFCFVLFWFLIF